MSDVTIDKLSIDIESNSTNASSGIDGLAKALKNLKKNSDISNAVTNLNNLRKSLHAFVNMPSNASKIESLANSLKSLKKVGKIDIGNSLASVKRSMESLGAIDIDGAAPQIERIAGALAPLNNVKGGGFNSTVNGLKKLDSVVDSLDSGSIDRFVDKIKEMDEKLGPVSSKLVAIGNAFKGVNLSAAAAGGGLKSFRTDINVTALNLTNFISITKSAVSALQPLKQMFITAIGDAIEWDGIVYQFGNSFGEQADIYYQKITEITDALNINKQMFMENTAMAASMLKGFGVNSADAREMGLGYTELAYDIWAAYNNVYKSLDGADGAMAAVRSAISGEVEPIRRAGFTIVDSQLKITAANHGLAYSSEKATEAQKSYLRYLTLVDQAHTKGIVGAYAHEMGTAEGQMRMFKQQLTMLSQTFGSVFLPAIVKVMPWLTAFVELVGEAIIAVANFFGIDIQKVDFSGSDSGFGGITEGAEEATGSVNDTTAALKELKNATIGIDELNVISPPTANKNSGGAGAGGAGWDGLDVDSLWDKKIWDNVQNQVDEIKERIKGLLPVVGGIGAAFGGWKLLTLLKDLDDLPPKLAKLTPTIKGLAKGLTIAGITVAVGKLVWDFTGAYLEGGSEADLMKAIGTTVLGAALARWLAGKGAGGITLLVSGVVTLTRLGVELKEGTVEISDPEAITTAVFGSVSTAIGAALTWKKFGPVITTSVKSLFSSATMTSIGSTIGTALSTGWTSITGALSSIPVWGWIAAAVVAFLSLAIVDYDFTEVGRKIGEFVGKACGWVASAGKKVFDWGKSIGTAIKNAFSDAWAWCEKNITWENAKSFVGALFKKETWTEIIWPKMKEIGKAIWDGLWKGIGDAAKNLWGNVTEFVNGFVKGFKDGFEIKSPSKKMVAIGKEILAGLLQPLSVNGLRDKIKEMWESAKKWWTGKAGLEKISIPVNLVKSGWSSIKKWIGTIPGVSQGVSLAKSGWSSVKNWVGTMPTLSAGIKLIKSGWTSVKSWLGSLNFNIGFKLPKIGVNWGSREVLGFKISYPNGFYTYARGGFPDMGEMFIAREAGPEMVGKIGSKTTVANNDQIVEAVSEGVYAAVLAAMRQSESNGGQSVNVYLDGRQITSAVEKRQRERGATIMGNQVYAY